MRQYNLVYDNPPVMMLAPAADAAGRSSPYRDIKAADKAYIVVHLNQGNAATVSLTVTQAQDVSGTGAKALSNAVPIWLNDNTAASDAYAAQTPALSFITDATVEDKIVIFEILPEACMDMVNGFKTLSITTGASNAANITEAMLILSTNYKGASPLSTYV